LRVTSRGLGDVYKRQEYVLAGIVLGFSVAGYWIYLGWQKNRHDLGV
jgi:hypothetical protein